MRASYFRATAQQNSIALLGGPLRPARQPALPARDHDDGSRTCNFCEERKPIAEFVRDRSGSRGYKTKCKGCHVRAMTTAYEMNAEARREYMRQHRAANGDELRQRDRDRYERDKDKRIELATEAGHRRRARLLGLPQDYGITVTSLRKRDGDHCHYCKQVMDFTRTAGRGYVPLKATVEHVLPLARGGFHVWENVALACWQCNLRKNASTYEEWQQRSA